MISVKGNLKSAADLTALVNEIGFLPLFHVGVPGFSVEEFTQGQWWTGLRDDPWGWRETAANEGKILYGKFFRERAGFISKEWFPKLANSRRDGYDFDSRWEEGLETPKAREIMECVWAEKGIMTSEIKRKVGKGGFEGALTRLQMQTYLVISGFDRKRNRFQEPYGWPIAVMNTPEEMLGYEAVTSEYSNAPEKSFEMILSHIKALLPHAEEEDILRILR